MEDPPSVTDHAKMESSVSPVNSGPAHRATPPLPSTFCTQVALGTPIRHRKGPRRKGPRRKEQVEKSGCPSNKTSRHTKPSAQRLSSPGMQPVKKCSRCTKLRSQHQCETLAHTRPSMQVVGDSRSQFITMHPGTSYTPLSNISTQTSVSASSHMVAPEPQKKVSEVGSLSASSWSRH